MTTKDYSPFTPGIPVPMELFIGRVAEIERMVAAGKKAVAQRTIERLFITGERGIGKSSICRAAARVVERDAKLLPIHVNLGGTDTLEEMARRIFNQLVQENVDRPWFGKLKKYLGDHVRSVDLFGLSVEFTAGVDALSRAVHDFRPAMRNLLSNLGDEHAGIFLVLDDLNGLAKVPAFANWLKSLVDEMALARDPFPFVMVLVGLPERRGELIAAQPSLDRVFDVVEIRSFSREETDAFFRRSFEKVGMSLTEAAFDWLWMFTKGYPVFLHEIGDAVFKAGDEREIDGQRALQGVLRAAELIGKKYIEPNVFASIRSRKYRSILSLLGNFTNGRFTRKELVSQLGAEEAKVFDNFVQTMKRLDVLRDAPDGERGAYVFSRAIYPLYFSMPAGKQALTATDDHG